MIAGSPTKNDGAPFRTPRRRQSSRSPPNGGPKNPLSDWRIMPDSTDGMTPRVSHSNPVTQAGFTMIPNAVMLRSDLSPLAKLVYGYLKHLAWRNETEAVDPPRETIAADLHVAEKTVTGAVRELQKAPAAEGDERDDAPRLVDAVRRGQGRTNAYVVNDPAALDVPESVSSRKVKTTSLETEDLPFLARARQSGENQERTTRRDSPLPLDEPPPVWLDGTQNYPLDALTDVCGIAPKSPRIAQAVVALNGRGAQPGIRALYWGECRAVAADRDALDELTELHADPERFARLLTERIRRKVALIRERQPWRSDLPPSTVRDLWLDIELTPSAARSGVMTAEDLERIENG